MFRSIVVSFVLGVMAGLLLGGGLVFRVFDVVRASTVLLSMGFEVRLFLWVLETNSAAFTALYLISQYSRSYAIVFIYMYGVLTGLLTAPYGVAGLASMIPHGALELYTMSRVVKMASKITTTECVVITAVVIVIAALIEAFVDTRIMYVLSLLTA